MEVEEISLAKCPNEGEINGVNNLIKEKIVKGAKKIIIKIPEGAFLECIDFVRSLSTEFIYLSIEVYEEVN